MNFLEPYLPDIQRLCDEFQVAELHAFGSVLTDRFSADSDVDLLVQFQVLPPLSYIDHYFGLKFALEELLQREVDLLETQAVRNKVLQASIDASKKVIYEQGSPSLVS